MENDSLRTRFAGTKFSGLPLVWLALSAVIGILSAEFLFRQIGSRAFWIFGASLLVVLTGAGLARILRGRCRWKWLASCSLAWLAFGLIAVFGLWHLTFLSESQRFPWHRDLRDGGRVWVRAEGRLEMDFRVRDRWNFRAQEVSSRHGDQVMRYAGGKFQLFQAEKLKVAGATPKPLQDGAHIRFEGWLDWPQAPRNRAQIDFGHFLERHGYHGRMTVVTGEWLNPDASPTWWSVLRGKVRVWIVDGIEQEPQVGVLTAMVLGEQGELELETELAFRLSGTTHLFSVSGLHVGILGVILWSTGGFWGIRRQRLAAVVILGMWLYTGMTGFPTSAVRAACMGSCMIGGWLINRKSNVYQGLGLAVILILVWDPRHLFQIGFQLSVGAVLGILLLHSMIFTRVSALFSPDPYVPRSYWNRKQWLGHQTGAWMGSSFGVSAGATIGTSCVMMSAFRMLVPGGVVANMLMVPMAFPIMCFSMGSVFFHSIGLAWIGQGLNQLSWLTCKMLLGMAHFFAALPFGSFVAGIPDGQDILHPVKGRVEVFATEKGSCVYFRGENRLGDHWLIDTGPKNHAKTMLFPFLKHHYARSLEGVILSHGDSQHAGALDLLMHEFGVKQVLLPPSAPVGAWSRVRSFRGGELARIQAVSRGFEWRGDDAKKSRWKVLFPPQVWKVQNQDDSALVVQVEFDGWKVIVLNDAGVMASEWMKQHLTPEERSADVLIFADLHAEWEADWSWWLQGERCPKGIIASERYPAQMGKAFHELLQQRGVAFFNPQKQGGIQLNFFKDRWEINAFLDTAKREFIRKDGP